MRQRSISLLSDPFHQNIYFVNDMVEPQTNSTRKLLVSITKFDESCVALFPK